MVWYEGPDERDRTLGLFYAIQSEYNSVKVEQIPFYTLLVQQLLIDFQEVSTMNKVIQEYDISNTTT